jgi:glycosyltransferase involved in cell wall biosynthesis
MSLSICLNMIVKNESHIIRETLEMLLKKIPFSYWVICDTGSTDNTCEIIADFFQQKQIQGELYNHEWIDFAHNRNLALQAAFQKTDWVFVFDADDEIIGNIDLVLNSEVDGYQLHFGFEKGISYQRVLLMNNHINWLYKSVIHEYVICLKSNPRIETLEGNYYIVSGKKGNRSKDPFKYKKDAELLEQSFYEAKKINDMIYLRYAFYCANSYKDAMIPEKAMEWYKIVLSNNCGNQEKYFSCLQLYKLCVSMNKKEEGIYYLVEAHLYDSERVECVYELINHYMNKDQLKMANMYYETFVRSFYEKQEYLSNKNANINKLFVYPEIGDFLLPFYLILLFDKLKLEGYKKQIKQMFTIVFSKKTKGMEEFFVSNFLFNLQFFIDDCCDSSFLHLLQDYLNFLEEEYDNINLSSYDYFLCHLTKYGITYGKQFKEEEKQDASYFSKEECKESKNILIYAGEIYLNWNYTYSISKPLGGSETAVASLAQVLPKDWNIFVTGSVEPETIENVTYIPLHQLNDFLCKNAFFAIIVSRFIDFYDRFPQIACYKSFIWAHDLDLISCQNVPYLLQKWRHKINACVCLTPWHKKLFQDKYPNLANKISVINNGLTLDKFVFEIKKVSNRFIYSSATERGLDRLLDLWPTITSYLHDAELLVCTYNNFPRNTWEQQIQRKLEHFTNIKHLGKLDKDSLYSVMATCEYWLYPTHFCETSCITAMEMLMSEVICLYYPIGGLGDTLNNCGLPIERGKELETILNLTTNQKQQLRINGRNYALTCSWQERSYIWNDLILS